MWFEISREQQKTRFTENYEKCLIESDGEYSAKFIQNSKLLTIRL